MRGSPSPWKGCELTRILRGAVGAEGNHGTSPDQVGRNKRGQGLLQLSVGCVARRDTTEGVVLRETLVQETAGGPVGV